MPVFITVETYRTTSGPFPNTILQDDTLSLQSLTVGEILALNTKGIIGIDSLDNALSFTVEQFQALDSSVGLDPSDQVALADTGAHIGAVDPSFLSHLDTIGVIAISPSDEVLSLDVPQFLALGGMQIDTNTVATLADSGSAISGLDTFQLGALAGAGIDTIDATDAGFDLTAAQAKAIAGGVALSTGDTVRIVDTGANIATISALQFAALGSGIDKIDASGALSLRVDQYLAIPAGVLESSDSITLVDTGAHIAALSPSAFGALFANGIDQIDSNTLFLTLSVAQYQALSPTALALTGSDTITIKDTGANLAGMSEADFLGLGDPQHRPSRCQRQCPHPQRTEVHQSRHHQARRPRFRHAFRLRRQPRRSEFRISRRKARRRPPRLHDSISLFVQDVLDLGTVALASDGTVTVADSELNLEALTVPQINTLGSKHVDILDSGHRRPAADRRPGGGPRTSNGIVLEFHRHGNPLRLRRQHRRSFRGPDRRPRRHQCRHDRLLGGAWSPLTVGAIQCARRRRR